MKDISFQQVCRPSGVTKKKNNTPESLHCAYVFYFPCIVQSHYNNVYQYTGRFIMYTGITKIYYRKNLGHVFTKPVQIEGTTQIPPPPPPPRSFFIFFFIFPPGVGVGCV